MNTFDGAKETDDPIPVCYCFEFTARQIRQDVLEHGRSTIRRYIQADLVTTLGAHICSVGEKWMSLMDSWETAKAGEPEESTLEP